MWCVSVVGEGFAFVEELLNHFGEWTGFIVFDGGGGGGGGGFGGGERCGSEIWGMGEVEDSVERWERERSWGFGEWEPVSTERVEVYGRH